MRLIKLEWLGLLAAWASGGRVWCVTLNLAHKKDHVACLNERWEKEYQDTYLIKRYPFSRFQRRVPFSGNHKNNSLNTTTPLLWLTSISPLSLRDNGISCTSLLVRDVACCCASSVPWRVSVLLLRAPTVDILTSCETYSFILPYLPTKSKY